MDRLQHSAIAFPVEGSDYIIFTYRLEDCLRIELNDLILGQGIFLVLFEEDVKTIAETVETVFARKYSTRKIIRAQNKESAKAESLIKAEGRAELKEPTLFLLSFSTLDQL
ncbi:MAG: hypothetical protein IJL42_02835 [Bacteroidales bacterium]|nr:hypothetical protein [Bacteroidales bacterium]